MRNVLFALLLFIAALASKAQENISYTVVTETENYAFAKFVLGSFYNDFGNKALEQKIQVFYGDDSKPIKDKALIDSAFNNYYATQIINPLNPNNPFETIDTIFSYGKDYTDLFQIWIKNNRFYFKTIKGKDYSISLRQLRTIKNSDILISALTYQTQESMSQTSVEELVVSYYKKLRLTIFNKVMKKEVAYYYSPLCKESNKVKWTDINSHPFLNRQNIQIINPENPTDPYDLIDSVIIHLPDSLQLNTNIFASSFNSKGQSILTAFSLLEAKKKSHFVIQPSWNGQNALSWIKWSDVEDILGKTHTQNLIQNYIWHTCTWTHWRKF